ncbi:MAG: hypothetical protein GX567_19740 [Clostridia bacterium]|nr:hypothetical protein [Clostridia bacterium]
MAHHVIDTSTPVGGELQNAINHLRSAQDIFARVKSIMATAAGAPANYTLIEGGAFGIATGDGDEVFTFVSSVEGQVAAVTEAWLAAIDQAA